ncbi:MAG: hypothetical protein P4L93_10695 [Coriobacteriia bacterium]|nr:hypothetical protein [Coriobacteriia bacterium]
MDLDAQRAELTRLGYAIVSQDDREIVATRSAWYPDAIATRLRSVVFVRPVTVLDMSIVTRDRARMLAEARELLPSVLPRWLQKSRAVVAVYLADVVDPEARAFCVSPQALGPFESLFYAAALDRSSGASYYWQGAPLWGGVYFSKLRFLVRRLTGPTAEPAREPVSVFGVVMTVVVALLLLQAIVAFVYLAVRG